MTEKDVKDAAREARAEKVRPLYEIAHEISREWKNVYFGAVPYLAALKSVDKIDDQYGVEDARTQVIYFLSNANSFRGEAARRIKKELKKIAGVK